MNFEEETNLILSMYPEDLTVWDDKLSFNVCPNTEYGVHNLVQCTLEITTDVNPILRIVDPKGLDEVEVIQLAKDVKQKYRELHEEGELGILFNLIDYWRERMTEINDGVEDDCRVCLMELGDARDIWRIPKCYHRFHRKWLNSWWFVDYQSEKDEFGCEIFDYRPKAKSCPLCLRVVENPEDLLE